MLASCAEPAESASSTSARPCVFLYTRVSMGRPLISRTCAASSMVSSSSGSSSTGGSVAAGTSRAGPGLHREQKGPLRRQVRGQLQQVHQIQLGKYLRTQQVRLHPKRRIPLTISGSSVISGSAGSSASSASAGSSSSSSGSGVGSG